MERKKVIRVNYLLLAGAAATVGLCCAVLAYSLKLLTEHFQHIIFHFATHTNNLLLVVLPTVGITSIYFLRKYIFKNRKNKGITEI